jgi:2-keto-4-pentenoate hydratase
MNTSNIDRAATALINARRSSTLLLGLPAVPQSVAEAYAIQDAVCAALGPVGGWKVGAKTPDAEPTCAPLPLALMHASPREIVQARSQLRGIEAEVAVRLRHDLPPRATPYTADDIVEAVSSIHPAIEVVTSRYADIRAQDPLSLLADSLSNGAFIYGPGKREGFRIDQREQHVLQYFGERKVADVVGGNPAGDILRLLVWLANHVAARCGGLRAGQIVTTGSCTGMLFAEPGETVKAEFPGLGEVETVFRVQ